MASALLALTPAGREELAPLVVEPAGGGEAKTVTSGGAYLVENPSARPWLLTEPYTKSVERLKILRAAWTISEGSGSEDLLDLGGSREVLLGRLREGLTQALLQEVPIHPDLTEAVLAEDFNLHACMHSFNVLYTH